VSISCGPCPAISVSATTTTTQAMQTLTMFMTSPDAAYAASARSVPISGAPEAAFVA